METNQLMMPPMTDQTKGILLMVLTTIVFATQDVVTKHLAQNVSIVQFTGIRYLVFVVFACWLVTRKQTLRDALRVDKPWLQIARSVLLLAQVMSFAWIVRLMIMALKLTAPVILQPFFYLILLWSVVLGYVFFDEVIAGHKWYGIVLIVGSGLFVALRQRRLKDCQ